MGFKIPLLFVIVVTLLIGTIFPASAGAVFKDDSLIIDSKYTLPELYNEINNTSIIDSQNNQYILKNCSNITLINLGFLDFTGCDVCFKPSWQPNIGTPLSNKFLLKDCTISGMSYYNTTRGIVYGKRFVTRSGYENVTLKNVYLYNVSKESFQAYQWNNCTVENVTAVNNGWALGDVGFGWYGGENNHMLYIEANGTARSGLDFTDNATNCSYKYFNISQARHGFVDFHGCKNCLVAHGKIHDGNQYSTDAIIISGGSMTYLNKSSPLSNDNNCVDDIIIYNYDGRTSAFYNIWNTQVKNVTGEVTKFITIGSANVDFINCTTTQSDKSIYDIALGNVGEGWEAWNCSIIDSWFADRIGLYHTDDCRILNTKGKIFSSGSDIKDYTNYYYVNLRVVNNSKQVNGFAIFVCNDTTTFSIDGNGDNCILFKVSNGSCNLPTENRNNSPAVASYRKTQIGLAPPTIKNFQHKVIVIESAQNGKYIYSNPDGFIDVYTITNSYTSHLYASNYGESNWFTVNESDYKEFPMESVREIPIKISKTYNRTAICRVEVPVNNSMVLRVLNYSTTYNNSIFKFEVSNFTDGIAGEGWQIKDFGVLSHENTYELQYPNGTIIESKTPSACDCTIDFTKHDLPEGQYLIKEKPNESTPVKKSYGLMFSDNFNDNILNTNYIKGYANVEGNLLEENGTLIVQSAPAAASSTWATFETEGTYFQIDVKITKSDSNLFYSYMSFADHPICHEVGNYYDKHLNDSYVLKIGDGKILIYKGNNTEALTKIGELTSSNTVDKWTRIFIGCSDEKLCIYTNKSTSTFEYEDPSFSGLNRVMLQSGVYAKYWTKTSYDNLLVR